MTQEFTVCAIGVRKDQNYSIIIIYSLLLPIVCQKIFFAKIHTLIILIIKVMLKKHLWSEQKERKTLCEVKYLCYVFGVKKKLFTYSSLLLVLNHVMLGLKNKYEVWLIICLLSYFIVWNNFFWFFSLHLNLNLIIQKNSWHFYDKQFIGIVFNINDFLFVELNANQNINFQIKIFHSK